MGVRAAVSRHLPAFARSSRAAGSALASLVIAGTVGAGVAPQPEGGRIAPWDPRGVHYWVAGCNVGEDLWKFREHSTTVWCDPRGRELVGEEGRFDWPVYLAPREINALVLEGEGLDSVEWTFWWGLDESFDPSRSIGAASVGPERVRIELDGAPTWHSVREHLLRLRLTWRGSPAAGSRLLAVHAE